jgi:hypothetical protein
MWFSCAFYLDARFVVNRQQKWTLSFVAELQRVAKSTASATSKFTHDPQQCELAVSACSDFFVLILLGFKNLLLSLLESF